MTDTSWERRLREELRELADVPGPEAPADRALRSARETRRRRFVLGGVGATALAVLIALPMLTGLPGNRFGSGAGAAVPCEEATDETDPPTGVATVKHPEFVRVVLAELPRRDDYSLQSAYGMCTIPSEGPHGYAVINLGHDREHGHLTVTLSYEPIRFSCAEQGQVLFCEDVTATRPMVMARRDDSRSFVVSAVYGNHKSVVIESHGTPLTPESLRRVVTAPELADLLP